MDSSNSDPSNQQPNFMLVPPHLMLQYSHPEKEKQAVELLWQQQMYEIANGEAIKSQKNLPLARIRKIMKSDKDVKKVTSEATILFAKACELFIRELTLRSWMETEECTRCTLQRRDIANAIHKVDCFDFLPQLLNLEKDSDYKEENAGGNTTEGNPPSTAGFINPSRINVDTDLIAGNQQFPQPNMMHPPFTPSAQFPYNFNPK